MLPFDMSHHRQPSSWLLSLLLFLLGSSSSEDKTAYRFICSAEESSQFSEQGGGDYILHSQKVIHGFHIVLERAVNSVDFDDMEVWIGPDWPAVKVMAKYRDTDYSQQYLKIDFVPAVKDGDRYYVAKPNKYDTSEGAKGKWRVSFSDEEKAKIYRAGEEKRKFLKIAKAFCKKDAPLARLDSYYLKTVFLHMLDEYPGYWTDTGDYFTKFLLWLLQYLQNGNLPMDFMQSHNLIDHFVQDAVLHENIKRRLQGIIREGEDEFFRISHRF